MKKIVTVVSVLCTGLLVVSPLNNIIYGVEVTNETTPIVVNTRNNGEEIDKNSYIDKNKYNLTNAKNSAIRLNEALVNANKKESINENDKTSEIGTVVDDKDQDKNDAVVNNITNDNNENKDVANIENNNSKEDENMNANKTDENKNEPVEYLTKEQSLNLLKQYLPNVSFYYKGDENTFEYIKDKGLKGYVFLPQVDGDLAYFVDKATSNFYYFHPSGYLELIK